MFLFSKHFRFYLYSLCLFLDISNFLEKLELEKYHPQFTEQEVSKSIYYEIVV